MAFGRAAEEAASRLAESFPNLRGTIIGVEGDRVLIDLGSKQKVYQGMELQAYREGDEVKHPVTGLVLGRRDKRLGLLRVVEVRDGFSEALLAIRQDGEALAVGDLVRLSSDRLVVALPLIDPGELKGISSYALTKDLAISLAKTGRFTVIEDHLIRAALMGERPAGFESYTEPGVLKALAERARAQLLLLGRLSPSDSGLLLNMQVISIATGSPLTVASVQVSGATPRMIAAPSGPAPIPGPPAKGAPQFVREQPPPAGAAKPPALEAVPVRPRLPAARESQRQEGVPSFLVKADDGSSASGDQVTLQLNEALLAVAAGDVDGDKRPEIVGITDSEVIVYRWRDRRLEPVARSGEGEPFVRNLYLDVADVNGSGQAQIFVTALFSVPEGLKLKNALKSFVLELRGGKLVRIADGLGYFLRVLSGPGVESPILLGQRLGEHTPFDGPVVKLAWSGERYIQGQPVSLPVQVKGLYDFAPLAIAGETLLEVAVLEAKGQVAIYDQTGNKLWEARDDLGEVDHLAFYQTPPLQAIKLNHGLRPGIPPNPEEYSTRVVLPRRLLIQTAPLWGDAKTEILTIANSTKYGLQVSLGDGPPPSGRIVAYDRRDGAFAHGWETVPVEGKIRDVAVVNLNGAGRKDLIVLSAVKEKGFVATLKSQAKGILTVFSFTR